MRYLGSFIALLVSVYCFAQQSQVIDTVIVTALRAPLTIAQTGRSITVIDAADIESYNATSIDEILQLTAGVEVQSRGGFGVQSNILLRGSTFTQVLVLVDGMRINDPLTGHFNSYIPVAQEEIAKIEVLRGAASAVFGPDAVGGVINIITKVSDPSYRGRSLSGNLSYGQFNLRDINVGLTESTDKLRFSAGVSVRQSDGELIQPVSNDPNTELESFNTFFDITTAGVGLSYSIAPKWQLNARTSYDFRDFNARYFFTTSTFDKSTETVSGVFNHVSLRHIRDQSSTQIDVAHKYNTDEFVFSPDFPSTNNHTTNLTNVLVSNYRSIGDDLSLKTGIQLDRRSIVSNDRGDHNDQHAGVYASVVYNKGNLNVIPNLRFDHDTNFGSELLPSLNISYQLPQLTLRSSAGRSVRAADYTERFVSNNLVNLTPGRNLGNPDLLTETSWSAEVGADFYPTSNWTLSSTLYSRWSNDLVDYIFTNQADIGFVSEIGSLVSGENYFFATNIADVQIRGVEFESNVQFDLGGDATVKLHNSLSVIGQSSSLETVSVYLSNTAKLLSTNRVSLNTNRFDINLTGLYKDRNARIAEAIGANLSEDYFIVNASAFLKLNSNVKIGAHMINVGDVAYQNILGAPLPGRWFRGSVDWSF